MNGKDYIRAVQKFNDAAKVLQLDTLPFDLPSHISRDPARRQELVESIETAVKTLQRIVEDMQLGTEKTVEGAA